MIRLLRFLRKKELREWLPAAVLLPILIGLAVSPAEAAEGAREGLSLCFRVIVPSLFPFFVLSTLSVELGLASCLGRLLEGVMRPLFRVSGSCSAAAVLGLIGGYPVGAATAVRLYRQGLCSRDEAERLLAFCNNSGPAFILGVVGAGVFDDGRVGLLLYGTHAAASLLTGLLFRFHGKAPAGASAARRTPIRTVTVPAALTEAVSGAVRSSLGICGFVVFFAVALRLLNHWGVIPALTAALARLGLSPAFTQRLAAGLLELSAGVSSLSGGSGLTGRASMAAFMLGWAGLSVHCQVLTFLVDCDLSAKTYLAGKLCHGLIAAGLTWLAARLIPLSEPVSELLSVQSESIAALELSSVLSLSLVTAFGAWLLLSAAALAAAKRGGKKQRHHI